MIKVKVRTKSAEILNEKNHNFLPEVRGSRKPNKEAMIVGSSDGGGHGFCYNVQYLDSKTFSWFDADELELI